MAHIKWDEALALERDVAIICQAQEEHGIYFDLDKAYRLIDELETLKEERYNEIREFLNFEIIKEETKILLENSWNYVKKIKLKNGNYVESVLSRYSDPSIVVGPFSRIRIDEPSISKRQSIVQQLLKLGWKPKEFTEKGFPQLTVKGEPVDTLEEVGPFGKALSDWYVYNHRQSQVTGFLPHVRNDHRIAAQIDTCATNTYRGVHRVVANIPRPSSVFGKEMRSLFTVPPNKVFVGADVSGLELRMLAHHMNDPNYIDQILNGDIHTYNMNMGQPYLTDRDLAKTFIYMFIYGGGDEKAGRVINSTAKDGKRLKDTFLEGIPALANLIAKCKRFSEKHGYIPSIDNRKIYIRTFEGRVLVHTALNAKLQTDGSIVTKRAMAITNYEIKRRGLNANQILFYHDEYAYESDPDCAEVRLWSIL